MAGLYLERPPAPRRPGGRPLVWRCAAVRRALWPYLDGELSDTDVADVEVHLTVCAACALEHDARKTLHRVLRRPTTERLDESARTRILARLAAQGRSVPSESPSVTVRPAPGR